MSLFNGTFLSSADIKKFNYTEKIILALEEREKRNILTLAAMNELGDCEIIGELDKINQSKMEDILYTHALLRIFEAPWERVSIMRKV